METLNIDIINPKAKLLLNNLEELNLIRINKNKVNSDFKELLEKLRINSSDAPTLEEITDEVDSVRKARYEY